MSSSPGGKADQPDDDRKINASFPIVPKVKGIIEAGQFNLPNLLTIIFSLFLKLMATVETDGILE